jgi:hypothetical protein
MTREEAIAYLGEDWEDSFEDQIFALKQQLLTLLPVSKLYQSKLVKWKKLEEAFCLLGGELDKEELAAIESPIFSNQIQEAFKEYQIVKNQLKLLLTKYSTSMSIEKILQKMVEVEIFYASKWKNELIDDRIVLSKFPDPMDLLTAIKTFETSGGMTFDDLKEKINDVPEILLQEQKRLTLYYSKYGKNE